VHAQDTTTDNDAETKASVPADRIADRYADSLFDGDEDAAADAVKSLRTGGDYTVKNADGTTTTVENTNGPMGYGEVNIALGMAEKQVDGGNADTWQDALYGTADTTNSDGTVTEGTAGILEMRADGMGWGKIAKELGFSLGSVVGKAPKRDDAESTSTAKSDRTSKADRTAKTTAKPAATAKTERAAKPEHAAKPERATKPERVEKPERVAKPERPERPTRPERVEKPERPDKPERGGRP
jgi:hypothetical protein